MAYATGIVARIHKILSSFPIYAASPFHKQLSGKELTLGEVRAV
jgi:hypothetical protein